MRLIDADALEPDADYDDGEYWAYSVTQIENAPTIEPERKKGKWTYVTDGYVDYFKCDRCGKPVFADTPYCPNCGARMEESNETD